MCRQSRSSREGKSPVKELPNAGVQAPKPRGGPCQRRPRGPTGGTFPTRGGCVLLWILGVSFGFAGTYVPVSTTGREARLRADRKVPQEHEGRGARARGRPQLGGLGRPCPTAGEVADDGHRPRPAGARPVGRGHPRRPGLGLPRDGLRRRSVGGVAPEQRRDRGELRRRGPRREPLSRGRRARPVDREPRAPLPGAQLPRREARRWTATAIAPFCSWRRPATPTARRPSRSSSPRRSASTTARCTRAQRRGRRCSAPRRRSRERSCRGSSERSSWRRASSCSRRSTRGARKRSRRAARSSTCTA